LNTEKKLLTMSSGKGEQSGSRGVIWINKEKGSEPVGIVMIENSPVSPIRVLLHPKQDGKIHR
jgi:predicted aconitase with swiveling domain